MTSSGPVATSRSGCGCTGWTGLRLDICESGVMHVTWELTREQVGREFFAAHTVSELAGWTDYDLEAAGRLSEPVRYDPASDRYVPVS
jgi:hypothetical protein